ncbi:syntaxin-6 [Culicoides brevitarsis]|uniref:syntaxin-6 n=1 Tax=Culicoides brevitarsis TaxID=469753 RepID=UPI00307B62AA
MNCDDPFFIVRDEVHKALNKTRGLYLRWENLAATSQQHQKSSSDGKKQSETESDWIATELRNALRSIEWDLEDLEETIVIVERNPQKFKLDNRELFARRQFIDATRDEVKSMKERMSINRSKDLDITARQPLLDNNSPKVIVNSGHQQNNSNTNHVIGGVISAAMAARHSGAKYSKLENLADDSPSPSHHGNNHYSTESPSNRFLAEQFSVQSRMFAQQDEQLDVISDTVGQLKTVSRHIGSELDEQAVMLDEFGNEIELTESRLDSTMKRVAKVLHLNNDRNQWTAIIVLSVLLLIIILLFIIL